MSEDHGEDRSEEVRPASPPQDREAAPPVTPGAGRRRRIIAVSLIVLLVVLLVIGGVGGVAGLQSGRALEHAVASDFGAGKQSLESGKTQLAKATETRDPADLQAATASFEDAQQQFAAAAQATHRSRLAQEGQGLPIVGAYLSPRVTAIEQLSVAGQALALVGQSAVAIDGRLITPQTSGSAPAQLVSALEQSGPDLDQIQTQLERAQSALAQVQPGVLPSGDRATVAQLRSIVGGGVKGVTALRSLLPVLVQVLGMNGPQTYLIEQVNPAELRAGGGFIGSFSVMQADQGSLNVVLSEGTEVTDDNPRLVSGQDGYVAPPGPLQQFVGNQSWVLGDSNFYPSFEQNGQAGISLLQHETGIQAQGVISIDPQAVADLLKVTGPLQVPGWGVTVTAANFADYIFQYENSSATTESTPDRKSFFGAAAGPLISSLMSLPATEWPGLVSVLNGAATQRDLQAYFTDPKVQQEMDLVGWSGTVNPTHAADFFLDSESNFGATKANHFLQRTYHVTLQESGDELVHKVTVDLKDSEPAGIEGSRGYRAYVRLYVPSDATDLTTGNLEADQIPSTEVPPSGLQMKDGWLTVGVDPQLGYGTGSYTFQYDTPATAGATQQMYWQKQPGTQADSITITWTTGGHSSSTTSTLAQDKVVVLGAHGVTVTNGHAATAQLPSLGF